jgi:hypothetical protein
MAAAKHIHDDVLRQALVPRRSLYVGVLAQQPPSAQHIHCRRNSAGHPARARDGRSACLRLAYFVDAIIAAFAEDTVVAAVSEDVIGTVGDSVL